MSDVDDYGPMWFKLTVTETELSVILKITNQSLAHYQFRPVWFSFLFYFTEILVSNYWTLSLMFNLFLHFLWLSVLFCCTLYVELYLSAFWSAISLCGQMYCVTKFQIIFLHMQYENSKRKSLILWIPVLLSEIWSCLSANSNFLPPPNFLTHHVTDVNHLTFVRHNLHQFGMIMVKSDDEQLTNIALVNKTLAILWTILAYN